MMFCYPPRPITVEELIKELSKMPKDAVVVPVVETDSDPVVSERVGEFFFEVTYSDIDKRVEIHTSEIV